MRTLKIYPTSVNERFIDEAVDELRAGNIIIYPTDTMYALGCDALNQRAIERLCRLKGIDPRRNTLSIVCNGLAQASEYARIDNRAYRAIKDHIPGPFTFILPAASSLPKVMKGRKEVGIRIPDNAIAVALASALGNPVMTATAEAQDIEPDELMDAEAVAHRYAHDAALVIDGGSCRLTPSAIVSLIDSSSPEILREGPEEW